MIGAISLSRTILKIKPANLIGGTVHLQKFSTNPQTLPFRISRTEANKLFSSDKKLMEDVPTDNISTTKNVKECFIPFHSVDLRNISTDYTVSYGKDRTEYYWTFETINNRPRLVKKERTITDWYQVSGIMTPTLYPLGTRWSQIYAGFVYPRYIMEDGLANDYIDSLVPLTHKLVHANAIVYAHEMNISLALEKINTRLADAELSRLEKYIRRTYDADHIKIIMSNVNLASADISLCSYYVPAYIYQYGEIGYTKYKIVNGYTGNIVSNRVMSSVKSMIIASGFGILATILMPYVTTAQLVMYVLASSATSALLGGMFAHSYNKYVFRRNKSQIENDINTNSEYVETIDDIERRKFTAWANGYIDYQPRENMYLLVDKLKLLQLDTDKLPTTDQLKSAYHKQIKRWHPDTNSNKEMALKMTIQLNLAYDELREIVTNDYPSKMK